MDMSLGKILLSLFLLLNAESPGVFTIRGKVIDEASKEPVPFANIGLFEKNIGTLSDPDGSFELTIPSDLKDEQIIFSSIGYDRRSVPIQSLTSGTNTIELKPNNTLLQAVTVKAKRTTKIQRLGWMGGKDGVLPLDTVQGGGAIALLVESPIAPLYVDKLQVRLMYNSKDTLQFRFHVYAYDSARDMPGEELLSKEIMLLENKRFGWLRFDMKSYGIEVNVKKFFIGFEWIDDNQSRKKMLAGLRKWEKWKKEQYQAKNASIERIPRKSKTGEETIEYKYHGNMMNWSGFKSLPPFTGLMVETGKHEETKSLRTFERKTSFGVWTELESTLNAVVTVDY
jgi:CarboxypepD_reg-like domain